MTMKFALMGVGSGSTVAPAVMTQIAQMAERLGYESVWIPEHLVVPVTMRTPYPYSADGQFPGGPGARLHDPFVALAYMAGRTSRIKLGTGVFVLPLRNPISVAKAVASLDVISEGRFLFGIGIGWLRDEFEAVGMPFEDRAERTKEWVAMLKALWTEETPAFAGRFQSFPALGFQPKPVQKPHPPILIGGETTPALRRAALLGDGWFGGSHTPESVRPKIAQLRRFAEEAGRDASSIEVTVAISPEAALTLDNVKRFRDAGVQRLVAFGPGYMPRSRFDTDLFPPMQRFADEVMAKIDAE